MFSRSRRSMLGFSPLTVLLTSLLLFAGMEGPLAAQAPRSVATTVSESQSGAAVTTTVGATHGAYHSSRVLVHFRPGAANFLPGSGPAHSFPGDANLFLVTNPPGLSVADVVARYKANPNVVYAEPDFIVQSDLTPTSEPLWPQQWDMSKISATTAWDLQTTVSPSVAIVAIVDTGIDPTHPDLQGNLYKDGSGNPGYSCFSACVPGGIDDFGHGTHVAGTIGAVGNNGIGMAGLNWSIEMMSFKFLDSSGSGYISDAVLAFQQILTLKNSGMKILVTNNSWGGGGYSQALKDAMSNLEATGTVDVCAAGNSAVNADISPMYPGAYDNRGIISVLATDLNDVGAYFTNYGLASVDIAAPGVNTISTVPTGTCTLCDPSGYKLLSGTSMATPHVTGVVAAMIQRRATLGQPPLTAAQARDVILDPHSYDPMTDPLAQSTSSGGRLNFYKVLTNPLLSSPSITLNNFPTVMVGPDVFTTPSTPVTLTATASDPDGDALRGSWARIGASPGTTWEMGYWLSSLIPTPSGNPSMVSIPPFSLPMVSPYLASYADNRGGGAFGQTLVNTSAGSPTAPPTESLSLSPSNTIPVGGTVTVNLSATGNGTIVRDVWAAGYGGSSGFCCYTGSVNLTFNTAGVYQIGSQAMDAQLNLSNRPTAVLYVGGAAGNTPTVHYSLDKTSGPAPLTVNVNMGTSVPPAGGSISYYYFICQGGGFTAGSSSSQGSCTFTTPGPYWILLEIQDTNGQVDIASAYVVATEAPASNATNTALQSSQNPSTYGQSVMFTATVTPVSGSGTPTGTVTFYDGPTMLGSNSLSGGQTTYSTSSLVGGPHSITATYGGSTTYAGSASSPLSQTVNKANSSTGVTSSLNPSISGQSVTFTAAISPSGVTGTVQFFDGSNSLGTMSVSGGKATLSTSSLSVGPHSITATYSGDGNFNGSTSTILTQTVNPVPPPSFTVSATPASQSAHQSSSASYTVKVTPGAGNATSFNVTLAVSGLPPQSTGNFSLNPVPISGTTANSSTLTVNVGKNTPKKTYTLTIKGTSGTVSSSTTVSFQVN